MGEDGEHARDWPPLSKIGASPAKRAAACLDLLLPACDLSKSDGNGLTAKELAGMGKLHRLAAKIFDIEGARAAQAEKKNWPIAPTPKMRA